MKKKVRLTRISNDEMRQTRAGTYVPPGCACDCTCNDISDGMFIGNGRYSAARDGGGIGPANVKYDDK